VYEVILFFQLITYQDKLTKRKTIFCSYILCKFSIFTNYPLSSKAELPKGIPIIGPISCTSDRVVTTIFRI